VNAHAAKAAELESAFLAGAEANLNQAKGRRLSGSRWTWTTRCQEERLRAKLIEQGCYDRELLRGLPKNTSRTLTGYVPRFFFGRRKTITAICSVIAPVEHFIDPAVSAEPPPPVSLSALVAHVKELVGEPDGPCVGGGVQPQRVYRRCQARGDRAVQGHAGAGRAAGRRRVDRPAGQPGCAGGGLPTFRPGGHGAETQPGEAGDRDAGRGPGHRRAERVGIGERLGLSAKLVAAAFEQAAVADPALKVSRQRDEVLLYRGAASPFESENSMLDRIKDIFSLKGNEARKINALSERRALLVQRRDRIYDDLSKVETREADLLKQGRESPSPAVKRRVASQIKQIRDDMGRLQASARMIGQQVDVISTHIHNLSLLQQGQAAKLPPVEEITQDAVRAEEMIEQLNADTELVAV